MILSNFLGFAYFLGNLFISIKIRILECSNSVVRIKKYEHYCQKPISHKQKSLCVDLCLTAKRSSGLFHLLFYVLVNMSCHVMLLTWV